MPETPAPAGPDAGSASTPVRTRRRRRLWPRLLAVVAGVVVLALVAVGVYAWRVDSGLTSNINRGIDLPGDAPSGESARPSAEPETGTLNYVLLGSDSRDPEDEGDGRSDSIMVVHLNKERDQASIISFPRDMYVDIPGHGKSKINDAYAFGGPALAVRTLEQLTNVRMDHVVLVGLEGFIGLTEDLGGVTVTNKTAFSSHGFDYPKGKVTLQGEKALWFVRERHSLPNGDLDRAENQRNVIKAIVAKGLSADVISDPARFTGFITNLAKHLTVDNSLTDAEIRRTALSLRLRAQDITLLQAPLSGFGTTAGGQSIDVVDTTKLAELSEALKKDTMEAYVKKYPEG
ncbi:cell envelope-related function transcriptional attenuator common domain-containing protein [Friedmanniella luteola]|uniref:Cell envelope-related function transcriptional attenuator common domain-containing protein n=1 Tax=Friedmanniella luteola TaxID=546871 RepID=A0A1H2ABK5_9ACTN|nr:LCP family protein [Friedmanniella luteola]SDT43267.1 cell envelope-related function transcriptional attenuator common domain-containing protein [Friedmanniella luteola]